MWNHRLVRHRHPDGNMISIHEVYYDESGKPTSVTANPVPVHFVESEQSKDESLAFWLKSIQEAYNKPILNFEDFEK